MEKQGEPQSQRTEDPAGDLAYIRRIMEESRRLAQDNGLYLVLWGGLCVICALLSYALGFLGMARIIPWVWGLGWGGMGVYSAIGAIRRKRGGAGLGDYLIGVSWGWTVLLGVVLVVASALAGKLDLSFAMGITSLCIGLGYVLSFSISRSKLILALAIPWWIGGIAIPLLPPMIAPAVLSCLTFFFEFLPGLLVYLRWKSGRKAVGGE